MRLHGVSWYGALAQNGPLEVQEVEHQEGEPLRHIGTKLARVAWAFQHVSAKRQFYVLALEGRAADE